MTIKLKTMLKEYEIIIEKGALNKVNDYLNLKRKVLIVTDENIPDEYISKVESKCRKAVVVRVKPGEKSKSIEVFEKLLSTMLESGFDRYDAVVSIGGGVVGDVSGFVASCYMRGIEFYNIPTSLLSQVDSSVGGKTAINLNSIKNCVGAFYQPSVVVIDPDTLSTLPEREFSSGMAEVIKMAVCMDKDFVEFLKTVDFKENIYEIICRSVKLKANVVEQDEKERNLRKVLNFGHTIGHGIEVTTDLNHGESVALGMLPMLDNEPKRDVMILLDKAGLLNKIKPDEEKITEALVHDKKSNGNFISVVKCKKIGTFSFEKMEAEEIRKLISEVEV